MGAKGMLVYSTYKSLVNAHFFLQAISSVLSSMSESSQHGHTSAEGTPAQLSAILSRGFRISSPFSGINRAEFYEYSRRMLAQASIFDLKCHFDGSAEAQYKKLKALHDTTTDEAERARVASQIKTMKQTDAAAFYALLQTVTGTAFSVVDLVDEGDWRAARAWKALSDKYEPKTLMHRRDVRKELSELRMGTDEDPDAFMLRLAEVRRRSQALKIVYTDEEMLEHLLGKIPDEPYAVFLASLDKEAIAGTLTLTDTVERLRVYYERHIRPGTSESVTIALSARALTQRVPSDSRSGRSDKPSGIECSHCKKPGHDVSTCWKLHPHLRTAKEGQRRSHPQRGAGRRGGGDRSGRNNNKETKPRANLAFTAKYMAKPFVAAMRGAAAAVPAAASAVQHWTVDSGCTNSVTGDTSGMQDFTPLKDCIIACDNAQVPVIGKGTLVLSMQTQNGIEHQLTLRNVLVAPSIGAFHLLSVKHVSEQGYTFAFSRNGASMYRGQGCHKRAFDLVANDGLWQLKAVRVSHVEPTSEPASGTRASTVTGSLDKRSSGYAQLAIGAGNTVDINELHVALGHPSSSVTAATGAAAGYKVTGTLSPCDTCDVTKSRRHSVPKTTALEVDQPLELVACDLLGGSLPMSIGGSRYLQLFVDYKTRLAYPYFLKRKSDATQGLHAFMQNVATGSGHQLRTLRTDHGGEFTSAAFQAACGQYGIKHQYSAPYTPQLNGRVESALRTVMSTARSDLKQSGLGGRFWAEAVSSACYKYNRTMHSAIGMTPYMAFTGEAVQLDNLHPFGCLAYVHIDSGMRGKLGDRARPGALVGYAPNSPSNCYRVYVPETDSIVQSMHVKLRDNVMWRAWSQPPLKEAAASGRASDDSDDDGDVFVPLFDITGSPLHRLGLIDPSHDVGDSGLDETTADDADSLQLNDLRLVLPSTQALAEALLAEERATNMQDDLRVVLPSSEAPRSGKLKTAPDQQPRRSRRIAGLGLEDSELQPLAIDTEPDITQLTMHQLAEVPATHPRYTAVSKEFDKRLSTRKSAPEDNAACVSALVAKKAQPQGGSSEPRSIAEALSGPDAAKWAAAIAEEDAAHERMGTLKPIRLSEVPSDRKILLLKYLLKLKTNSSGIVTRYKARSVLEGNRQEAGIDYVDTYAPVVASTTMRLTLALVALLDMELDHLDIVTAFLNAPLDDEIYARKPREFTEYTADGEPIVYLVQRSIYGLKQAPHNWNATINAFLLSQGFTRSEVDPCLYYKYVSKDLMLLLLYVDDMAIASTNKQLSANFKAAVKSKFNMTDLGALEHFIGFRITRDRPNRLIYIDQQTYIEQMLTRYGLDSCKPADTPAVARARATDATAVDASVPYRSAVGSLLYASVGTRPDIADAVRATASRMVSPTASDWMAVKRIFRYLRGTAHYRLKLGAASGDSLFTLVGMCDANFTSEDTAGKCVSGYLFKLGAGVVSWSSRLQPSSALSTCEAEYMAQAEAACEAVYLRELLAELGFEVTAPTVILADNTGAIALANDRKFQRRTKHIQRRYHKIRDLIQEGTIVLQYVPTHAQLADVLTKPVPAPTLSRFVSVVFA